MKDNLGGHLVDDWSLFFCILAGLVEGSLSGDGRESFIPTDELDFRGASQGLNEYLRLGGGGAVGAIHISRHSDNDGLRPAIGG